MWGFQFFLLFQEGTSKPIRHILPAVAITDPVRAHVVRISPRFRVRLINKE